MTRWKEETAAAAAANGDIRKLGEIWLQEKGRPGFKSSLPPPLMGSKHLSSGILWVKMVCCDVTMVTRVWCGHDLINSYHLQDYPSKTIYKTIHTTIYKTIHTTICKTTHTTIYKIINTTIYKTIHTTIRAEPILDFAHNRRLLAHHHASS
ncbi:hypothetical protein RRG08_038568 [Elysia crispata]|uniref:Uncharacterized protein n=1 Tax=Elysia crispata TaxID=231223 RepID=A0AAE0YFY3_9GAST|nr:hypothetical protein RRG08_038568 [Elysia crispata]